MFVPRSVPACDGSQTVFVAGFRLFSSGACVSGGMGLVASANAIIIG